MRTTNNKPFFPLLFKKDKAKKIILRKGKKQQMTEDITIPDT